MTSPGDACDDAVQEGVAGTGIKSDGAQAAANNRNIGDSADIHQSAGCTAAEEGGVEVSLGVQRIGMVRYITYLASAFQASL